MAIPKHELTYRRPCLRLYLNLRETVSLTQRTQQRALLKSRPSVHIYTIYYIRVPARERYEQAVKTNNGSPLISRIPAYVRDRRESGQRWASAGGKVRSSSLEGTNKPAIRINRLLRNSLSCCALPPTRPSPCLLFRNQTLPPPSPPAPPHPPLHRSGHYEISGSGLFRQKRSYTEESDIGRTV